MLKNNFCFLPIATINDTTTINRLHPPYEAIRIKVAGNAEARIKIKFYWNGIFLKK